MLVLANLFSIEPVTFSEGYSTVEFIVILLFNNWLMSSDKLKLNCSFRVKSLFL